MAAKAPLEIWETQTAATTWLWRTDDRGRETQTAAGGRIGARLTITTEDRELNQMRTAEPKDDPFLNGTFTPVKVHTDQPEQLESPNSLSRADMVAIFAKTGMAFQAAINKVDSEITLRRLRELANEVDAKASQTDYLDKKLEPFKVTGGQMPSYRMIQGIDDASPGGR